MADTARDATALAKAYQVIAHSLSISLEAATKLLDNLLKNPGTSELAKMTLKVVNDQNHDENNKLLIKNLHPEVIPEVANILKREEQLAANIVNADQHDKETKNSIAYFSCQSKQVNLVLSEALARSGIMKEVDRNVANQYLDKLKDNPMLEIKGLRVEKYQMLMDDISKMEFPLNRITFFPKYYEENGSQKVDVGFLSNTSSKNIRNKDGQIKIAGPYSTADIIKGLLVKQQILENSKNGATYEEFINKKAEYRNSIQTNYLNLNNISRDGISLSSVYDRIKRLNISNRDKGVLVDLLNKSKNSRSSRNLFVSELNKLEIDQQMKDNITQKVNELSNVDYLVPATVSIVNNEPVYQLDRNYISIGATVVAHADGKATPLNLNKAEDEIDYFIKANLGADDRTVLVLNEKEFEAYNSKKKFRKDQIEFAANGGDKISDEYIKIKDMDNPSERITHVMNENKEYFEASHEGMDILDIESEKNSPGYIKDLFMDYKSQIIGDLEHQEKLEIAIEDVEDRFIINPVADFLSVDKILEDIEQDAIFDDKDHDRQNYNFDPAFEDNPYDINKDGIDDRDQFEIF